MGIHNGIPRRRAFDKTGNCLAKGLIELAVPQQTQDTMKDFNDRRLSHKPDQIMSPVASPKFSVMSPKQSSLYATLQTDHSNPAGCRYPKQFKKT